MSSSRERWLTLGSLLALAGGVLSSVRSATQGGIDYAYLHVAGLGVLTGTNIYTDAGKVALAARYGVPPLENEMFYPPATGFAMAPWALLPFSLGKLAWIAVTIGVLVLGVRALVRLAWPDKPARVWWFLVGIVLVSSSVRWGLLLLQGAPLMLGLLGLFVAALHGGRPRLALAIAIYATVFKMTLALPFAALLLLHRRWLFAFAVGASWVCLNAVGFAWLGEGALAAYRINVAGLQSVTDPGNIDSPDPWLAVARPRIDWVSLFYGIGRSLPVATALNLLLTAGVALWLVREGWRVGNAISLRTTALFLGPLVCLGSLCVYHHHYDASLCLLPALLVVLLRLPGPAWARYSWLPLSLVLLLLPIGVVQGVLIRLVGVAGAPLLKMTFPVLVSVALAGSLALLGQQVRDAAPERR